MSVAVNVEVTDGVGVLELARPDKFNCISRAVVEELRQGLDRLESDPLVRVVLLRGQGKVFCTGADLTEILEIRRDEEALSALLVDLMTVLRRFERSPLPVVVAVHGLALAGGLELVMACDIVFAAQSSRLGDQHAQYGLVPGGGNSQRLTRVLGRRRALELMLSARWLDASEAERFGLVNYVVPDDALFDDAFAYCKKLASHSASGLATIKRMADEGLDRSLDDGLAHEVALAVEALRSADADEGLSAFAARRAPVFRARTTG
jgi:enoyl-CoA hydratase/carnithine racemase